MASTLSNQESPAYGAPVEPHGSLMRLMRVLVDIAANTSPADARDSSARERVPESPPSSAPGSASDAKHRLDPGKELEARASYDEPETVSGRPASAGYP